MNAHTIPNRLFNPTHPIKVCLVGAGGTGSLVLSRLARMHHALKQADKQGLAVTVYDDDTVEEFNIGRQMFTRSDVGEYKSFSLVGKINRAFGTFWKSNTSKFTEKQWNDNSFDIYITAVDNAKFRIDFNTFFKSKGNNGSYWMDFGNARNMGQCVLGSSCGHLETVVDLFPNIMEQDTEEIQGQACSYNDKLMEQSLFINDSLATPGCNILWDMLKKGFITVQGVMLNNDRYTQNALPVKKKVEVEQLIAA